MFGLIAYTAAHRAPQHLCGSSHASFCCTSFSNRCAAADRDSAIKISVDFPHFGEGKKLYQDIYCSLDSAITGTLSFACYRYNTTTDSLAVYAKRGVPVKAKAGLSTLHLPFGSNDATGFVLTPFYAILRKHKVIAPGSYKLYLTINTDSGRHYQQQFSWIVDSLLPATAPVIRKLDDLIGGKAGSAEKGIAGNSLHSLSAMPALQAVERSAAKTSRMLHQRGLDTRTEQRGDKVRIHLWHEDWYVGHYELDAKAPAASQILSRQQQALSNVSSLATNEIGSYRSIFSQARELASLSGDQRDLRGELALSGNSSTGQPEYSAQDNNYYEIRGQVETEVADIPVSVEGYYTSQDAHRQIKGSYIRIHYDANRAKDKLMKLISGYRTQFGQTMAKGQGLGQVYGSYLTNLQGSKDRMMLDIARGAGVPVSGDGTLNGEALRGQIEAALAAKMRDTAGAMLRNASGKADSAALLQKSGARAQVIKDSAAKLYAAAVKGYEQVKKTETQITRYRALLDQYKNTVYFDSAMAYSKIRDLQSGDQTTYKAMAKSAAGLLPEGKAKTFIAGLTSFDAGIFPKYVSKYTMAGQQLKGASAGYDIGFAQIGLAAGVTEYAGRDGRLDKYSSYTGSILFAPAKDQKAGLVYYGYTPSSSMLRNDEFFRNRDIALPSFREPVHVVSATYAGTIARNIIVDAEAATSFRKGSGQSFSNGFDADRLAWHINAEGQVPRTPLRLIGSYEHGGRAFQNSTLPVMPAGTDLYKAGIKGEALRGFLTGGIEFNHMRQSNLYSTGGNNRWGFEIATHSKQYPSFTLSYKPFATFRAFTDTLAIPQRPLQGAVWAGKASYQIKRSGGVSYRFSAVLNRSTSQSDTVRYGADLLQLNAIYTDKRWMIMVSGGQSALSTNSSGQSTDSLNPAHLRTTFGMGSLSYVVSKDLSVSGGADIGVAPFGLSKWGANGGAAYRLPRAPFTVRVYGRYSAYRLAAYSGNVGNESNGTDDIPLPMSWRPLFSGGLEIIWRFKMDIGREG